MPVWAWCVVGVLGYLVTIGTAHGVIGRVTDWDMTDGGLLAAIFWPLVLLVSVGLWIAVCLGMFGSRLADVPGLVVRAYRWVRSRFAKPEPGPTADDSTEYRSRPCPECGR